MPDIYFESITEIHGLALGDSKVNGGTTIAFLSHTAVKPTPFLSGGLGGYI